MGNNQSLSSNSSGFLFPNSNYIYGHKIPGNMPDPSLFDEDSMVDDLSEDQFIGVIHAIIKKIRYYE